LSTSKGHPEPPGVHYFRPKTSLYENTLVWQAIMALIGKKVQFQEGAAGAGDNVAEALRDMAGAIDREGWQFPELEPWVGGPVRVK
jgi:hypothetical protein